MTVFGSRQEIWPRVDKRSVGCRGGVDVGPSLSVVEDPHWCWYAAPGGGLPAKDALLKIQRENPRAAANALVAMRRVLEGGARDGLANVQRD